MKAKQGLMLVCMMMGLQVIAQPVINKKPKLVIGIVIDQMRWDYLYRFNTLFSKDGFNRMMNDGFSCDNTFIPYTPTVTACGHTCIYTGSVPAIHGITGNAWVDRATNNTVYCAEDKSVKTVGSNSTAGEMSPRNMLTTTIGDELRLSSNFKSRVYGVAVKDRGSILPAGHAANGAYWYDSKSGSFITSSYYMDALPAWVTAFNNRKLADSLYTLGWKTSKPAATYDLYATADNKPYEVDAFGSDQQSFPYKLDKYIGKDYGKITSTPHGNTLVASLAMALIANEKLGKGNVTDMLTVSFSSPDIIGHAYGPNSWETVDGYIKLDETLAGLFKYLDATIGKGEYLSFLTADHAVAHIPAFMQENKLPGGQFNYVAAKKNINNLLLKKYKTDKLVTSLYNYQVYINQQLADSLSINMPQLKLDIIDFFASQPEVARVFDLNNLPGTTLPAKQKEMITNGWYPARSGEIQYILKPGYVDGGAKGTSHGLWNPYDSHIPLLWYGTNIRKGKSSQEVYMTDIAPTVAALLQIQMPSGSIGKVIEAVVK